MNHVRNFLDCVKSREKPKAEVEISHKSVTACHIANIATRLQRYVAWDAEKEMITGDPEASEMVSRQYRSPWKL
jgi:hypothetical protein